MVPIRKAAAVAAVATGSIGMALAAGLPDGSTPEQQAVIAADPPFIARPLTLVSVPAPSKRPRSLFNGWNLSGWDSWLGYQDPSKTYAPDPGKPIGLNHDTTGVFSVVTVDGEPALFVSGKTFGGLLTKEKFRNYHLHAEFKWGEHRWTPMPRNNGILYHSSGSYGAWFGTWMQAVEFEIVPHTVGMLLTVGDSRRSRGFDNIAWNVAARVRVGHDASIVYPHRRYMPDGKLISIEFPAYNADAAVDAEKPPGEWNSLDLYTFGDRSVHVVNGVPVLAAQDLKYTADDGRTRPLTSGRIQLQSEGAETYFRHLTIEPIDHLPVIDVSR